MESIYDTLLRLPLFAGVSHQKMSEIVGKFPFHFLKYADGDTIIRSGEPYTHLTSVISGQIITETESPDGQFRAIQTLIAPNIIAPHYFFGRTTLSPHTATASGAAGILKIAKSDFLEILKSDSIFLFNYLNILSLQAQISTNGSMALIDGSPERRIAFRILTLTQPNSRNITLHCKLGNLHSVFGLSKQAFIGAMNRLSELGIINFTDAEINVNDRRELDALLNSSR